MLANISRETNLTGGIITELQTLCAQLASAKETSPMRMDTIHSIQNILFTYIDILHCHHKKKNVSSL